MVRLFLQPNLFIVAKVPRPGIMHHILLSMCSHGLAGEFCRLVTFWLYVTAALHMCTAVQTAVQFNILLGCTHKHCSHSHDAVGECDI